MNFRRLIFLAVPAFISSLSFADSFTFSCVQNFNGANYGSGQIVVNYTYAANGNLSYTAQYQACTVALEAAYTGTVSATGTLVPAAKGSWKVNLTTQTNLTTDRNASEVCTVTSNGTFTPSTTSTSSDGTFNGKIGINNCNLSVSRQIQAFSGPNAILNYLFDQSGIIPTE